MEIELCEISMHNLLRGQTVDAVDFIDRSDALQALGKTVLVSRCAEFHRLAAFLSRCTRKPVGIILSIGLLNELFKAKWSANLAGGLLESFGRLFKEGVTLHVFPWKNRKTGELVTAGRFRARCGTSCAGGRASVNGWRCIRARRFWNSTIRRTWRRRRAGGCH